MDGHLKFSGVGVSKAKIFKGSYEKLNQNFQRGVCVCGVGWGGGGEWV